MDRRFHYSPKDLLKILESPRNTNGTHCWDLDTTTLLRQFQDNVNQAVTLDFATAALVLQGAAKLYSLRINSLDKDTEAYMLRLSSFSRVEEVQNVPENEEPEEIPVPVVIEKPIHKPKPIEEPIIDPIMGEIVVTEKPSTPVKKTPKPVDINVYLEELFVELQKSLQNFDPESASKSIFTVVDRQLRRRCCDIFIKYLNEPIPLMEVLRRFLNDVDPDLVLKPIEHKHFLATKMILLVDVRREVFIPNLSNQDDQLQIRVALKEYLLEEIVRLTCHDDCLPHEDANLPQGGAQTVINGTLDSGIDQNFTVNEVTSFENESQDPEIQNISSTEETVLNNTTDTEIISNKDLEIPVATQDSGFVSSQDSTMDQSCIENQNDKSNIDTVNTLPLEETGDDGIQHSADQEDMSNVDTVNTLPLEETGDDGIQHSAEDTESLLIDCEAIRECQETATSMTVNKVQFLNIFGLSKRLLRKKSFFRLPDDILEWARIHRKLDVRTKETRKNPTKTNTEFKLKPRNKKVLAKFINKNRRSSLNKIHLEKLQTQCFIPLESLSPKNEPSSPPEDVTLTSENPILVSEDVQNTLEEMKSNEDEGLVTTQEMRGTPLNEIFENNLLSSASCFDDESGVERDREHYEDDIETDSYKTLTHYSNVESGIFTDMTSRDNTPSCNQSTRNNSFFSEYHDDITNMTDAMTPTTTLINRTLFNRFDTATQQLEEVPEGNVLNQIAERMQNYQEKERQLLELYRRVDKWHQSIRERLMQAKRRENWDVIVYEDKILKKVPVKPESIHFALLVVRKSHEEICRDFLATLILANEGNIIITKINEDPWAVNNFTLSKAVEVVRNHEVMNARMGKMSGSKLQGNMLTSSSSLSKEIPLQVSDQIPFLHRPYGSEQSDDEEDNQNGTRSDDQVFMQNVDNLLNYYDSDQDELQPEARLNIEYDRPVPQTVRRRGRKPRVLPKNTGKNTYVFDNKEYDSSDLDDYVARIVKNVDAFEKRSQSQEVIVNSDLPVVLSAPGSRRKTRNDIPSSPKTKLSISRRNELNGSRRRIYDSSSDDEDDNTPLTGLYTPRRLPAKRKAPERNTNDSYLKRFNIFDDESEPENRVLNSEVQDRRLSSSKLKRKSPEKTSNSYSKLLKNFDEDQEIQEIRNRAVVRVVQTSIKTPPLKRKPLEQNTTDSYLKRFKIFDDDEEINKPVSSKLNNYAEPGPSGVQNRPVSRLSEDYAIPGPSGLQKNQRYKIISSDDDYSSSDSERRKMNRKRSPPSRSVYATSTPFDKKSKVLISPGDNCFNLSRISPVYGLYDSDS
ncbi:uncharacterized protein LOC123300978 [Chrysoperla carnea]|uniref:uncharacterized protein LOC123300978 n=1 Tax=Chrysoperla carnea TaxID=189513 RepID=UPI001D0883BA|nr:uncharacterized protein LOC123300978 [Chrysoperla carnea]